MESIEQMIKRLCPRGVEYVKLGDLFVLRNGYTPSKGNVDFWTDGTIPWFRMEDIRANGRILNDSIQHITPSAIKGKGLFPAGSFILATTATIGEHALLTTDSLANQQFTNLSVRKTHQKDVNVKFLHHYMFIIDEWCKKNVNSSSFASVDMNKLKEYMIPIPPLEIQSRIVEVLDKMITLTAELKAELKARIQQYEYYRNKLLTFSEIGEGNRQVTWKKISEIGTVMRGTSFQKKHFTDEGTPCIHYGQIYTQYAHHVYETISFVGDEISRSPRRAKTGALVMATTSENIEDVGKCIVWLGEEDVIVSNDACFIQHNLNPKYLGYLLQTESFSTYKKKVATGTKVIRINADAVADFVIPVPSMQEQQRIVSILDRFEALTTDLQSGLPAEIEARRQQYEYYRNKLLTFEAV